MYFTDKINMCMWRGEGEEVEGRTGTKYTSYITNF